MLRVPTCLVFAAGGLLAQAPLFPHHVLTQLPATGAQIVAVDAQTGALQSLGAFASSALPALAITVDPFDGALLVAVDNLAGGSNVVRLVDSGAGLAELPVATVSGTIVALDFAGGDVIAAVDASTGGLYRMPRRGGSAQQFFVQANVTALNGFGTSSGVVVVAWTGRPGTATPNSGTAMVELATGLIVSGPDTFPNPGNVEITGVIDLPTGVPRQLLSFDDGTFALFAPWLQPSPQPVPTTPAVPFGGAAAMHGAGPYSIAPAAVGGSTFPFVYTVEAFSGAVTVLSAALPGTPVDFVWGITTAAHSEPYGTACGAVNLAASSTGAPQLGTTMSLHVQAPAGTLALFVAGFDDFVFGALPAVLPGGCLLETSPDVVLLHVLGATAFATQPLSIPAVPALTGTRLFTQWAAFDATGFSTSTASANWIGP